MRCRDDLVVKNDGEQPPDILLCRLAKTGCALGIEAETHDGLVGPLIECRLRIHEVFTRNDDPVFDQIGNRRIINRVFDRRSNGRTAVYGLLHRHRLIHHLERKLGRLAEDVLQALRILKTRHLNQNSVVTLALNDRLGCAELVDTTPYHLDGLRQCRGNPVVDSLFRQRIAQQSRLRLRQLKFGDGPTAEQSRIDRLCELAQRFLGLRNLAHVADSHLNGLARTREPRVADPLLAQQPPDIVTRRDNALFDQFLLFNLQKNMRTALKVETQSHRP